MDSLRKEVKEEATTRVVVGVIVNNKNEILVGQRVEDGKWELIGGEVKPGEKLETGLVELINKEVGPIGVFPKNLVWEENQRSGDNLDNVKYIKCDLPVYKLPTNHPDRHSRIVWRQGSDLINLDMTERDRRFAQSYEQWRDRLVAE